MIYCITVPEPAVVTILLADDKNAEELDFEECCVVA